MHIRRIFLAALLIVVLVLTESTRFQTAQQTNAIGNAPCSTPSCHLLPFIATEPKVAAGETDIVLLDRANNRMLYGNLTNVGMQTAADIVVIANIYKADLANNLDFVASMQGTAVFTYLLRGQTIPFQIGLGVLPPPSGGGSYTSTVRVQSNSITDTPRISPTVFYTPTDFVGGVTSGVNLEIRNTLTTSIRNLQLAVWSLDQDCVISLQSFDVEIQPGAIFTHTSGFCPSFTLVAPETIKVAAQAAR